MAAVDTGLQSSLSGMTQVAAVDTPRDLIVVASAAKAAVDDVGHGDQIAAGAHLKLKLIMADLAAETDAVEPVREDHGAHAILFRLPVDHDIGILGLDHSRPEQQAHQNGQHHAPPAPVHGLRPLRS